MSAIASAWALEVETGSPTNKLVLLVLADRHNKDTGKCCPSIGLLAKDTELSESSVKRALTDLEKREVISKVRRTRANGSDTASQFTLHMEGFTLNPQGSPVNPLEPELEPEEEQDLELDLAAPPPTRQHRNDIWDALSAIFGEPGTRTAKALRGKIAVSLLEAGATVEQIHAAPAAYRARMPQGTLFTETALEKHWTLLLQPLSPPGPNMKYGRRDVSGTEMLALADRLKAERLADERKALAPG